MLGDVDGATVLDLFAGTGALGIEALSRGAKRAVFVERDRARAGGAEGQSARRSGSRRTRPRCAAGEALGALRSARERAETYDLVLIDPPYRRASDWEASCRGALEPLLAPQARVVVESDRRAPLELPWEIDKERRYGDTTITIHRHR